MLPLGTRSFAAETITSDDAAAIRYVIEQQIAAFQRDDGEAAFAFASPNIRTLFGSPEEFMSMVKAGYQAVYRPQQMTFKDIRSRGGQVVQGLVVIGPDGFQALVLYYMEHQPAGDWRIDGVQLYPLPDQET